MATKDRGFASMPKDKQKEIASKGGKAAHARGTAHQWTTEEAREAGSKGGSMRGTKTAAKLVKTTTPVAPETTSGEQAA